MSETGFAKEIFREQVATLIGVTLSEAQLEQFALYEALLLDWNQYINLTAVKSRDSIRTWLFANSLLCAPFIQPTEAQKSLIDIGSGAGLPGIPLKILYPQLAVTLVDSVAKKTHFLQTVVDALALPEVTIVNDRAEQLGQTAVYREQYDWVVARAVAEMRVLAEYLLPLCRVGGLVVAHKGREVMGEVAAAATAITQLGGGEAKVEAFQESHIVLIPKVQATPDRYPRRAGMAKKRPL